MALPSIAVPNFSGGSVTVYTANSGRQDATNSAAVVLSTEDKADLAGIRTAVESTNPVPVYDAYAGSFEYAAAGVTDQVMGTTGDIGDKLSHVTIQPTSTTVGAVTIKDGATTIYSYPGGTVDAALKPWTVPMGLVAKGAGFTITTGAGVTATGFGNF